MDERELTPLEERILASVEDRLVLTSADIKDAFGESDAVAYAVSYLVSRSYIIRDANGSLVCEG